MKRYIRSNESNEFEYEYRLLDRLRSDCDYVLRTMDYGSSFDSAQKHFWAKNWQDQIAKMREIYSVLPEKPEWLSEEDIDLYENKFRVADGFEPVEPMSEAQTWSVRPGEQPSRLIESSRKPAPRRRAIKANEVYRNNNPMEFSKFLGDVSNGVKAEYGDTYDIKGTRFVDDEVVIYELIVRDRYNSGEEISYLTIEQSADGFRVWREGDEETEFAVGKSFDDILEDCIDECGAIIEEVEGTEY